MTSRELHGPSRFKSPVFIEIVERENMVYILYCTLSSMGGGWSLNSIRDTPSFNSINRKTISNHEYENRTLPPQN